MLLVWSSRRDSFNIAFKSTWDSEDLKPNRLDDTCCIGTPHAPFHSRQASHPHVDIAELAFSNFHKLVQAMWPLPPSDSTTPAGSDRLKRLFQTFKVQVPNLTLKGKSNVQRNNRLARNRNRSYRCSLCSTYRICRCDRHLSDVLVRNDQICGIAV